MSQTQSLLSLNSSYFLCLVQADDIIPISGLFDWFAPFVLTLRLGDSYTLGLSLKSTFTLKLGETSKHGEHLLALRCCRIDILLQGDE